MQLLSSNADNNSLVLQKYSDMEAQFKKLQGQTEQVGMKNFAKATEIRMNSNVETKSTAYDHENGHIKYFLYFNSIFTTTGGVGRI